MATAPRPSAAFLASNDDTLSTASADSSCEIASKADVTLLYLVRALARQAAKDAWDNATASQPSPLEIPA